MVYFGGEGRLVSMGSQVDLVVLCTFGFSLVFVGMMAGKTFTWARKGVVNTTRRSNLEVPALYIVVCLV